MRDPMCGFETRAEPCVDGSPTKAWYPVATHTISNDPMHPSNGSLSGSSSESDASLELSVVIPCLNEADTVTECVMRAIQAMRENRIAGEVVVADNGSADGSAEIARSAGARVVPVTARGYGSALMGGIAASRGRFIIMGDAE
jgi:cellulose synthase/poly-beta-1,6-N-acetylglucosamine synthase-like glycosyltransferase